MDNKRKTSPNRLDNYVRSFGTVLPKDILFYRAPDGDKHALCVFCDRHHDHQPILRHDYASSESAQVVEGVFSCDACATVIERMEKRILGDRPGDVLENALKYSFGEHIVEKNREKNINNFLNEGIFPPFAYLYYQHLPSSDPLEAMHRINQCVFCDAEIQEFTPDTFRIQAPMGPAVYHLDGGDLLVCGICSSRISDAIPEIHFDGWVRNTFVEKTCPKCTASFLITKDEDEYQSMSKTSGQHLCPACAYRNVDLSHEGPLYFRMQETDGRLKRYMDSLCNFCSEFFSIDQTLSEAYVLKAHVTAAGKITCLDCCYQQHQPVASLKIEEMVWTFYFNDVTNKAFGIKRIISKPHSEIREFSSIADMYRFFSRIEEVSNG